MIDIKEIGYARNPEPPEVPDEEERVEYLYGRMRGDFRVITRCFENAYDSEKLERLARLLATYEELGDHGHNRSAGVLAALKDWLDSEVRAAAEYMVEQRSARGDFDF